MDFLSTSSIANIVYRSELLRVLREFFSCRNFIEVQTPVLSADVLVDRYVEPICVRDNSLPLNYHGNRNYYLQTSPEFAMKRLLVSGLQSIYQICPAFRRNDRGKMHNIEFTMLEWYRAGDDYETGMNFLAELIVSVFDNPVLKRAGKNLPTISFVRFEEIFVEYVGQSFRNLSAVDFRKIADLRGVKYPESYTNNCTDESVWLDLFFSEFVQPELECAIVYDYPVTQSQLARCGVDGDGNKISERFELFLGGVEVANGYHELTDAAELRIRLGQVAAERGADNGLQLPVESRLLRAMEYGLPESSGTALGIERLLMYLLNAESIDDVITFPIEYC
ncbi:MAG: EF-P lysine aminoacylase GenX [Planctomycetaceae bacterium]|jgi:lysyl-tRNA synthetase class 2|nr:EF-P lysine aminoacylase GenX [Planctomycetaceae bacterium]